MDMVQTWMCSCGAVYAFDGVPDDCPDCGGSEWQLRHDGPVVEADLADIKQELQAETVDMQCRMNSVRLPSGGESDLASTVRLHESVTEEYEGAGRPESADLD